MKYILLPLCLMLLFSACRTNKQPIPTAPVILTNTDNVRTEYIETVRIDTITVEVPIPDESAKQIVPDSVSHVETSLAESDAWINPDGTLGHSIKNKKGKMSNDVLVPNKDIKSTSNTESVTEKPVDRPVPVYVERELTWWESFKIGSFWYLLGISLISVGWKFRKPLLTAIKKCLTCVD